MPRDILAQTELLPFLAPVQRTVKIIPSEEIHVQTLFVEEWAARTINQTLFTPKGNRVLDIRLVQRTETATGSEADGKNPAVRYQRERTYKT